MRADDVRQYQRASANLPSETTNIQRSQATRTVCDTTSHCAYTNSIAMTMLTAAPVLAFSYRRRVSTSRSWGWESSLTESGEIAPGKVQPAGFVVGSEKRRWRLRTLINFRRISPDRKRTGVGL